MKVIVSHPNNPDDILALQKKAAAAHAEAVLQYVGKLPCSKEDKLKLLDAVIERTRAACL